MGWLKEMHDEVIRLSEIPLRKHGEYVREHVLEDGTKVLRVKLPVEFRRKQDKPEGE